MRLLFLLGALALAGCEPDGPPVIVDGVDIENDDGDLAPDGSLRPDDAGLAPDTEQVPDATLEPEDGSD